MEPTCISVIQTLRNKFIAPRFSRLSNIKLTAEIHFLAADIKENSSGELFSMQVLHWLYLTLCPHLSKLIFLLFLITSEKLYILLFQMHTAIIP